MGVNDRNDAQVEIMIGKSKIKFVTFLVLLSTMPLLFTIIGIVVLAIILMEFKVNYDTIVIILCFASVAFAALFGICAWFFSRRLIRVVKNVGAFTDSIAAGNLSVRSLGDSPVQEISDLIDSTMGLQKNLDDTIGKVKAASTILVEKIADVTDLTGSTFERANQIEEVIVNLTDATNSMTENVQNINQQVIEIGNCVNDIYGKVDILHENSENMLEVNSKTNKDMLVIQENSDRSLAAVRGITEQINAANASIKEIDTAVELILNISDQTNLLSLNASIEAARAGEYGKGFAVVAEEIRSLAEQSAKGAEAIRHLAQKITKESSKTVSLADNVLVLIQEGSEKVGMARDQYDELSQKIKHSAEEIDVLMQKADQLSEYKTKIVENIHDLSAISEQNAASHQEVNANVTEIVTEVRSVKEDCENMNGKAKILEEVVKYFHK